MIFQRNWIKSRWCLSILILLLIWPIFAWYIANQLIVNSELDYADELVILGGSSTYLERTNLAAELFREGRVSKILLTDDGLPSGWSTKLQRNPFFFERAIEELEEKGVPRSRIEVLSPVVNSTYDEAILIHKYVEDHKIKSLIIVTSAYHSRRARWIFRKVFQGSQTRIGLNPVSTGQQTPTTYSWWIYTDGWRLVIGEYLKSIYYWLKYS
jgi:uncharacterized SAM-binding protein YcdF (DUF218 family)